MSYGKYILLFSLLFFSYNEQNMIKPQDSVQEFNRYLKKAGTSFDQISIGALVEQQIRFYRETRIKNVSLENDGDMILVQWGIYDWGAGQYFEFDLARQYIEIDQDGDDAISQFHTTLFFDPAAFSKTPAGNQWFNSVDNAAEIEKYILLQEFYKIISTLKPVKREMYWEYQ